MSRANLLEVSEEGCTTLPSTNEVISLSTHTISFCAKIMKNIFWKLYVDLWFNRYCLCIQVSYYSFGFVLQFWVFYWSIKSTSGIVNYKSHYYYLNFQLFTLQQYWLCSETLVMQNNNLNIDTQSSIIPKCLCLQLYWDSEGWTVFKT